ncbi:PTS sugar transporter subunit IIB [Erwinia psidii]|uniref:PTS sugar transporter subunit IIB n=1 Tax=Erwinia psidii TaxID=69224 RepID=A0A3N6S0I4_9GAMM|nr:PTS sugar transporter subunit IIB [Erwinia psidii]MCX8958619.1 PTS sugar transporter subunit IIB [Erwinia psidii]MCX8963285.1 PTS sugar transporter subunit IIB [Erwinia psidii]MCX8967092.1 PTS sugar transporter subunit IIB [Erwinia psidii]RQM39038.1 PTS sugar transporter subunit IIB [Erwinia psidii]
MKYKIMLACMGGFSTSMLVKKMRESAEKLGIDAEIDAVAETELDKYQDLNIIMLGPQVGHLLDEIRSKSNVPVSIIDSLDYGLMNGEKVLKDALQQLKENELGKR